MLVVDQKISGRCSRVYVVSRTWCIFDARLIANDSGFTVDGQADFYSTCKDGQIFLFIYFLFLTLS